MIYLEGWRGFNVPLNDGLFYVFKTHASLLSDYRKKTWNFFLQFTEQDRRTIDTCIYWGSTWGVAVFDNMVKRIKYFLTIQGTNHRYTKGWRISWDMYFHKTHYVFILGRLYTRLTTYFYLKSLVCTDASE